MVRSPRDEEYREMRERFALMCEAAASATGCRVEIVYEGGATTMKHNRTLDARFAANLAAYGLADRPPTDNLGSSDMGNVSQVVPTIHPSIAICAEGVPGHSIEFREAAVSPLGDAITLLAATVVAQTAYELFADAALVDTAWAEFRATR
jgi:metal-dependent amidase/aminoacylase/carboxypeptidase family protein